VLEQKASNTLAKTETETELKDLSSEPDEFDQWYSRYPRKEAKENAKKAFIKARRKTSLEALLSGLEQYKQSIKGKDRQFIALPASWLNAGRWEDEAPQQAVIDGPWSRSFHEKGIRA
jgi:hypothetical protein